MLNECVEKDDSYHAGYNPAFLQRLQERRRLEREAEEQRRKEEEAERRLKEYQRLLKMEKEREAEALSRKPDPSGFLRESRADIRFRKLMRTLGQRNPTTNPQVREIIDIVAERHGVTRQLILGPSRRRHIMAARHEAIVQARKLRPELSLPQLGRQFNRDHTTILHALRKAGAH